MKLTSTTELDKRKTEKSKNFDNEVVLVNYAVIIFFSFLVDLEQSSIRIPNAQSFILTFSSIATLNISINSNI